MPILSAWRRFIPVAMVPLTLAVAGRGASGAGITMTAAAPQASLDQRLRGKPAILAVGDNVIANHAADGRFDGRFADATIPRPKARLVEPIGEATDGPCSDTGWDLRAAHAGMGITDAEFAAPVEDLVRPLGKLGVPPPEQKELLGVLGGMRGAIVGA